MTVDDSHGCRGPERGPAWSGPAGPESVEATSAPVLDLVDVPGGTFLMGFRIAAGAPSIAA